MTRQRRNLGQILINGIREIKAGGGKRYTVEVTEDNKSIRERLGMTQQEFADMLNVHVSTIVALEQEDRQRSAAG